MHFVLIHGRPATGKLTVARELARLTGFRVFDNHLVVDAALAIYDFGTPGFIALRDAMWRGVFGHLSLARDVPGLIFTFNPENTVPQCFIDDLFGWMRSDSIAMHSVQLTCAEPTIEERLASTDRSKKRKLVDVALYRKLRAAGVFETPVVPIDFSIDTERHLPKDAALEIVRMCELG